MLRHFSQVSSGMGVEISASGKGAFLSSRTHMGRTIVGGKLPLHAGDSGGGVQQPLRAVDLQQQDMRHAVADVGSHRQLPVLIGHGEVGRHGIRHGILIALLLQLRIGEADGIAGDVGGLCGAGVVQMIALLRPGQHRQLIIPEHHDEAVRMVRV